jgi:hypothetical protein
MPRATLPKFASFSLNFLRRTFCFAERRRFNATTTHAIQQHGLGADKRMDARQKCPASATNTFGPETAVQMLALLAWRLAISHNAA